MKANKYLAATFLCLSMSFSLWGQMTSMPIDIDSFTPVRITMLNENQTYTQKLICKQTGDSNGTNKCIFWPSVPLHITFNFSSYNGQALPTHDCTLGFRIKKAIL